MKNLCIEAKIPVPQFSCKGNDFWTVFRKDIYYKDDLNKLGLNERQVKAVLFAKEKGKITNSDYQTLNKVSKATATRDLTELINKQIIFLKGTGKRDIHYALNQK